MYAYAGIVIFPTCDGREANSRWHRIKDAVIVP
jgi:hypothetical protein